METLELLGSVLGLGLAAGFRLYATVLAVGLGLRFHLLNLNPELSQLQVLADTRVLVVAGVAFLLEFLADKIPWVDSLWDVIHTVIRPLGAALVTGAALGETTPAMKWILVMLAGGIAFSGHSTKAATRLAVNHSPEPFSNIALSMVEDVAAPAVAWFALNYPLIALAIVVLFLVVFIWVARKLYRLIRRNGSSAVAWARRQFGSRPA